MKVLIFLLAVLAAVPFSARLAAAQQATPPAAPAVQGTYTVVPGDRLTITVLEDPNLNSQVLVRPDGRITLPIAGAILVNGLSPEQIQAIIRERLSPSFSVVPTVNVALSSTALPNVGPAAAVTPVSIYVLGQVTNPGAIQVTPPQKLNVLQALAQAGGLTQFGKGEAIQIRRVNAETGEETIFAFNYGELEEGRTLTANITLEEGDVIFVPERGLFD